MALWLSQFVPLVPLISYIFIRQSVGPEHRRLLTTAGFLAVPYSGFVLLMLLVPLGRRWVFDRRYKLVLTAVSIFLAYITCELGLSLLVTDKTIWLLENSCATVNFDAVRGYRLGAMPARSTRITNGVIEYVGVIRGNNDGFPDRDDFHARRPNSHGKRFVVLGDSFTAGQYLAQNWPDFVEDRTRDSDTPVELLNFSLEAGGLANWWSVLTRIIEPEKYQIDGVIFAAWGDDLDRRFVFMEHGGYARPMKGRSASWDPRSYPATREEAHSEVHELPGYIVTTEEFDRALAHRPWRRFPFLARRGIQLVQMAAHRMVLPQRRNDELDEGSEERARQSLFADIRRSIRAMGVPVMVVSLPARESLTRMGQTSDADNGKREFAKLLDAEFIDGSLAFKGLTKEEIRDHWLPFDGHWAQKGSDRFGRFMTEVLRLDQGKFKPYPGEVAPSFPRSDDSAMVGNN